MPVKVTYLLSDIHKALAFEWIVEEMDASKIELSFILFNNADSELEQFLVKKKIKVLRIKYRSKFDLIPSILSTFQFLKRNKTEIVHCHLFDASFIGLIAAKLVGIKKRFYTRHYSTYNHDYHPTTVKWDKFLNRNASLIIAISETVKETLIQKEGVDPKKVVLIHHGFKLKQFKDPDANTVDRLRTKYNSKNKGPVIGVISRFIELKGVQYIIPAFKEILKTQPDALLLLFNAQGSYQNELNKLLQELPQESYQTHPFESELASLYHLFDIFVHVPVNSKIEAFGQTYIECLAAQKPLIATLSGIGSEILQDRKNALIVPYCNINAITEALLLLLNDKELKKHLVEQSHKGLEEKFGIDIMIQKLESVYLH